MSIRYYFAATLIALTMFAKLGQSFFVEETHIVKRVVTEEKVIALTFDDGPHPKTTDEILKVLKEKKVKATFFALGENVKQYPEIVTRIKEEGHEVASHSYTHRHLPKLNREECAQEMDEAEKTIGSIAGKVNLFRPPGGLYNETVLEEAKKRDYTIVLWSVDTLDWQRPGIGAVVKAVMDQSESGGIVLMHDGLYPMPTPKALSIVIDKLRAKNYSFVTVSELLTYEDVKETGTF